MTQTKPELFDETKINDAINCPRLFYFNWRLKIKPMKKSFALDFGTVYHDTKALFFNSILGAGGDPRAIPRDTLEHFEDNALTEFEAFYQEGELGAISTQDKNLEIGLKILKKYFKEKAYFHYGKILEVEATLYDEELKLAGKVDLITQKDDVVYIIDHKTTSKLDKSVLTDQRNNKWKQRRSFIGYRHLVQKYFPAQKYMSLVNVIHCIKGNGRDTYPNYYHVEFEIPEFRLLEWKQGTKEFIQQIWHHDFVGLYPKTGQPCNDLIWGCPYLEICNINRPLGKLVIPANFEYKKEDEWYV